MSAENSVKQVENLCAHTMPLYGIHLIEASAGTGKTYNITRLYLRLLLERRLTVEQILVMTFTKDATEELRGRIDASIREAINYWHEFIKNDDYFIAISKKISSNEALFLLKAALLTLDEAAIFTIHGFCKRVLTQHAFATGMNFNAQMETDCKSLLLEGTQDWYRYLAKNSPEKFALVASFWQTPDHFFSDFSRALNQITPLQNLAPAQISADFNQLVEQAKAAIIAEQDFVFDNLINNASTSVAKVRMNEFNELMAWFEQVIDDVYYLADHKMPSQFFHGGRFKKEAKSTLQSVFYLANEVKQKAIKIIKQLNKAQAYLVVKQGIYHIREQLIATKQQHNVLSFDDLISLLAQALNNIDAGSVSSTHLKAQPNELAQRLFKQYPVALVDEFQDTDAQQFDILKALYFHGKNLNLNHNATQNHSPKNEQTPPASLYLIGDPKQAIYGFRGGDVFAYLSARNGCDRQWLMDTNWRSSSSLITAYNRLFWGNKLTETASDVFGYNISYTQVKVSPKGKELTAPDQQFKALQFVHINPDSDHYIGRDGAVKQPFRVVMAKWCAQEIKRLLTAQAQVSEKTVKEKIVSKDIAILVRDGREASEIKAALTAINLNSVYLSDRENLLKTPQAQQLISLLKGILFVENDRLFTAAVANPLMGLSALKFYQLQQQQSSWQALKFSFLQLRAKWQHKSFIAMALALLHQHIMVNREKKDRTLTNLLHLFELLQSASQRHNQGQELIFWFEQQIAMDEADGETELRLESDEDLIKIVTQHGSKGLEYPIVFVPFVTRHKNPLTFGAKEVSLLSYHDQQGKLQLSLDDTKAAKTAMSDEAYAETVRLLYVAITRAKQRCYLLTTNFDSAENSPLGRTLKWQQETNIALSLQQLAQENNDNIGFVEINEGVIEQAFSAQVMSTTVIEPPSYMAQQFNGNIEGDWWLSSFSALTKSLPHSSISRPDRDNETSAALGQSQHSHLLRFTLTKGAKTGNLLHTIFEHCDFSAPNWSQILAKPFTHNPELEENKSALISWLDEVLQTPLCQLDQTTASPLTLATLSMQNTLRESEFYFPMQQSHATKLAQLLTQHRQTSHQQAHNKENSASELKMMQAVNLPSYQQLNGMMHGFIDLIFCDQGKYYIADYKSNFLGDDFNDYNLANLTENIEQNHYDLQYLIYALALHRYLQQRLEQYNAEQHFGGVYYLYLRGMTSDKNYSQRGVFYRKISPQELQQLDELFSGDDHSKNSTSTAVHLADMEQNNDQ